MAETLVTRTGDVAVLTLNRPNKLNAMTEQMIGEIEAALDRHETSDVMALVITGAGRGFCAGSDLTQPPPDIDVRINRMHAIARRLVHYPKLSVAALNGLALGGGLELALACTLRVASPEAKLGLPEVKLATLPAYGGVPLLIRAVGEQNALRMLLTGDPVAGEEAHRIGLITLIDPDPLEAAIALAERCTAFGQPVQRAIRRSIREMGGLTLDEAWALEHDLNRKLIGAPESVAAIQAFVDRARMPV